MYRSMNLPIKDWVRRQQMNCRCSTGRQKKMTGRRQQRTHVREKSGTKCSEKMTIRKKIMIVTKTE